MFNYKKRGQETGTGAAVLVLIIASLIIFYIMFIPAAERNKILDEDSDYSDDNDDAIDYIEINLLETTPGKVTFLKHKEVEHSLSSLNLFSSTSGNVIKEVNSVYVKNAVFDDKNANFSFSIEDLENTENVLLTFQVGTGKGILNIDINDKEILNTKLGVGLINPIKIPVEFLSNDNIVKYSVSSVGVAFWKTNEYALEKIKLTADVTDVSTQVAEQSFIIDKFEKENLEKVSLVYFPDCTTNQVGVLRINLNNCKVFTGVPSCNELKKHEVPTYCLNEGENLLQMESEKGHYLIDRIKVRNNLKQERDLIYDFYINDTQYKDIRRGSFVNMSLRFADPEEEKNAKIIINGKETTLSTREIDFDRKLNVYLSQGSNVIKIVPKNDFYIAELKVDYFERD